MLRVMFMVMCCVLVGAPASVAAAQTPGDFVGEVQPTLPANEQLLAQITNTIPSSDLDSLVAQSRVTLGVGEGLQSQLKAALALAPDDAARSRLEGVLAHTDAAVDSLRMIGGADDLVVARGRLDQARGEANEGLDELRPFVLQQPGVPQQSEVPQQPEAPQQPDVPQQPGISQPPTPSISK